ncbi:hypothetical protein EKK58_03850 [Candidatus Dependentiae bacterium]|nr:MAG: hypothetical protein EKK58_03850 [Candidatus Dependentiae bacterium]
MSNINFSLLFLIIILFNTGTFAYVSPNFLSASIKDFDYNACEQQTYFTTCTIDNLTINPSSKLNKVQEQLVIYISNSTIQKLMVNGPFLIVLKRSSIAYIELREGALLHPDSHSSVKTVKQL